MVLQTHHLILGLARENVSLPLLFSGVAPREQQARADALLSELGLSDLGGWID